MAAKTKVKKSAARHYFGAVGRRKTATARVRLFSVPKSEVTINGRTLESYFPTLELRQVALGPFAVLPVKPKLAVHVKVTGGGISSQAGAVAHGLARALVVQDLSRRPLLKKHQYLRRDSRMKERRKFGLKKARKAPQWSKR